MRIIIDANLPDISREMCKDLGITEVRKITADTADRVIYDSADKQNFDLILTRDSDFEPFTHEMLKYKAGKKDFPSEKARAEEELRRYSRAPKIVFFKRNSMSRDELETFVKGHIEALKTFAALKNPDGDFGLQYLTVSEDEFKKATQEKTINSLRTQRRSGNLRPYMA